jgi:hypothetical protein
MFACFATNAMYLDQIGVTKFVINATNATKKCDELEMPPMPPLKSA